MTELDRVFDELAALREQSSDTAATAARIEERIANFTHAAEERARKQSDRVKALEMDAKDRDKELDHRVKSLETWRWVLLGAYGAIPLVWLVVTFLRK